MSSSCKQLKFNLWQKMQATSGSIGFIQQSWHTTPDPLPTWLGSFCSYLRDFPWLLSLGKISEDYRYLTLIRAALFPSLWMASVSAAAAPVLYFRGIIVVAHAREVNDSPAQTHPQHLAGEEGDEITAATKAAAPSPCSLWGAFVTYLPSEL